MNSIIAKLIESFSGSNTSNLRKIFNNLYATELNLDSISSRFSIDMENQYLSPDGDIIKTQHLRAIFKRQYIDIIAPRTISISHKWINVNYSQKDAKHQIENQKWAFPEEKEFTYIMSCKKPAQKLANEYKASEDDLVAVGDWFDDMISTPSVNLMKLLTWDIITFEELHSQILHIENQLRTINCEVEIETMNGINVHLNFKGCSTENSFFKNGKVKTWFSGIGFHGQGISANYSFKSIGRLEIEGNQKISPAVQKASSFFIGSLLLNGANGDLIEAEMSEIISGCIVKENKKIIPVQKRRIVKLKRIYEGS